jgi:hypothetical protein
MSARSAEVAMTDEKGNTGAGAGASGDSFRRANVGGPSAVEHAHGEPGAARARAFGIRTLPGTVRQAQIRLRRRERSPGQAPADAKTAGGWMLVLVAGRWRNSGLASSVIQQQASASSRSGCLSLSRPCYRLGIEAVRKPSRDVSCLTRAAPPVRQWTSSRVEARLASAPPERYAWDLELAPLLASRAAALLLSRNDRALPSPVVRPTRPLLDDGRMPRAAARVRRGRS